MELNLTVLDGGIIVGYFALVVIVGLVMNKMASKGIANYFLGGKTIPWWVLGASGTASNFDIAGTTVIISFIFALGFKGFWVAMRGGVGLPLAFLMVFLGKWYRRSKVMTEAEFMKLRFGEGKGGKLARKIAAIANIVFATGMVIYFSKGVGLFLAKFLTIVPNNPTVNQNICAAIMLTIGLAYTVSSGLYGVVFTDVVQEIMIIIVAIYISVKAFFLVNTVDIAAIKPDFADFSLPFQMDHGVPPEYSFFTFSVLFFILKGVMEGVGGLGGYMSQRYYASKNEKEAGLLTLEWILLLGFRWTMIMGIAVMGMSLVQNGTNITNPEHVLSIVIRDMLPEGIKGLALAGLIAAAMSTFDSTINAGASYFVKDIYQGELKPEASEDELMKMSRLSSVAIAVIGFFLSMTFKNINEIWSWITASLTAGLFVPLILRWYWERFNGFGFAYGTGAGVVTAIVVKAVEGVMRKNNPGMPPFPPYVSFSIVSIVTLAGCIIATFMTPETDPEVRKNFLRQIRVGGLWDKTKKYMDFNFVREITIEHLNDIISVILAVPAQVCFLFGCMALVLHDWPKFFTCLGIVIFCSIGLYFFWYKNLRGPEVTGEAEEEEQERLEAERIAKEKWEAAQAEA